ncbi:magnesium/cobalt transporter CorA [Legionella worsleiensis]|uniref:Magnesium transport protein CorA n=1 Tax=Legionella worsleiensis TaxID=45076 RepID=A0A0W1AEN9_9GAMM|nr:magnesium/cobalt transporter CorA [Legionella worsleiensis]KTD79801.1 cobalt/magnesium uptake transporter [Legionella worsleiensis]STY32312.1 metal ion transporter, MIT family [Legionella worsleiensis]
MSHHKKHASSKTGLLPGTAVYVGENPPKPTHIYVHIYDTQSYKMLNTFHIEAINAALREGKHIWIDVAGLEDSNKITHICNEYAIHPLVIEDLLNTRQRPKIDIIEDYLFIVFKLLETPVDQFTYSTEQFSLIIKQNLLITFRESDSYDLSPIYKRLSAEHSLVREHGSDYLTYLVMDYIVDDYFNFVEETSVLLEKIEDQLIKKPEFVELQSLYTIKRRTITLRKTIAPLRDIVHLLLTDDGGFIKNRYNLYFRDLYDHCIRLVESIDLHREMSSSMLDIYLSTLNNRMNETMKILTMFASIFIPLTFIVGVYGMNFEFMPELRWRYGYPLVLTGMVALAVSMLFYFKRKKLF